MRNYTIILFLLAIFLSACKPTPTMPSKPKLNVPANGSTVKSDSVYFLWYASTGSTSYHIQISTDSLFSSCSVDTLLDSDTSHVFRSFPSSKNYHWRLAAINNYGDSGYSSWWRFSVTLDYAGTYRKLRGAGGVFENARMIIKKSGAHYKITTFNSHGKKETNAIAILTDDGKLVWSDGWLSMMIYFDGDKAKMKMGVKSKYGQYEFQKIIK